MTTFHPFSREHFVTVCIGFLLIAILILLGRKSETGHRWTNAILVFCNLSAYPFSLAAWLSVKQVIPPDNYLPFHLCDLAAIIAGFALITRRPVLCALTYFWGLAGTFQALVTPNLSYGFPAFTFFTFFIQHFAIVAAALYLPLVNGWKPKSPFWKSPLEIYGWSVIYLIFSLIVNRILGSNFGFTMHHPENPSLIDHLGPWPWYLFSMQAIAVVIFLLLALPFSRKKSA
jgi:hypothetical integral membrane protein (TIGR02206 family)